MKKHFNHKGGVFVLVSRALIPLWCFFVSFGLSSGLSAQSPAEKEVAFHKTLSDRSAKIVAGLGIRKEKKTEKLTKLIAAHYYDLNTIHDQVKEATEKTVQLQARHDRFIRKLNRTLAPEQVEGVKNGMTYNVLNVTYTAYQDMILTLTSEQKEKIYNWLVEAREKAMMEGSSEDKHKMFGKYKGRINNYLSEQGYNMKAEEKAWQQRIREKKEAAAGKSAS